jgi:hypothetical protein
LTLSEMSCSALTDPKYLETERASSRHGSVAVVGADAGAGAGAVISESSMLIAST